MQHFHVFIHQTASLGCLQDADIVLVEYTSNDLASQGGAGLETLDTPTKRGFERLLRALLARSGLAVLVLHSWAPKLLREWTSQHAQSQFYSTYEDDLDIISKYYGVPSLSFRNSLHNLVQQNQSLLEKFWLDNIHPSEAGHACLGLAVTNYFSTLLEGVKASTLSPHHTSRQSIPAKGSKPFLGPPMFIGNHYRRSVCQRDYDFFQQIVQKSEDWVWEDSTDKLGFSASSVGATLTVAVPQSIFSQLNSTAVIGELGTVQSGKDYGTVLMTCKQGCSCQSLEIDCHTQGSLVSVQIMSQLTLLQADISVACLVHLQILDQSSSQGHFVKVMSLALEAFENIGV